MIGKKRSISFSPSSKFYAKNSLQLNDHVDIPVLGIGSKNTFMTDFILNPTIERRKNEFKILEEYDKVINEAKKIIAEDCNLEKLRALPKIGDSQLRIKAFIEEKKNA